jgi:hypothetical protein
MTHLRDRFDAELSEFLAWRADDLDGAPTTQEMVRRVADRVGAANPAQANGRLVLVLVALAVLISVLAASAFLGWRPPRAVVDPRATSPVPSASVLPELALPGTRLPNPAGEYGWQGSLGDIAGMHRVVETRETGTYRQTQLVFANEHDCFAHGTDGEPERRTVAGLETLYVEPYEAPDVLFVPRGVETTGAYALPIGDRTLCVYLSWDPDTTPAELSAAREVVESIRGQPMESILGQPKGRDGIRIIYTLPAGWDTG